MPNHGQKLDADLAPTVFVTGTTALPFIRYTPLARLRAVVAERWPAAAVVCESDEAMVEFVAAKLGRVD